MKTVIIDNYDSFTYNLAHLVKELGAEVDVLRNDKFRLEELEVSVWANKPSDKRSVESWSIWKRCSMGYRRR